MLAQRARSQPKQWELRGRGTIAGLFEAVFPLGMASPTGTNQPWTHALDMVMRAA